MRSLSFLIFFQYKPVVQCALHSTNRNLNTGIYVDNLKNNPSIELKQLKLFIILNLANLKKSKLRRHSHTLLIKKEIFTRLCPPLFHVYSIYIWSGVSREFRFKIKAWFPQKCGLIDICFFHILKYFWYPGSALMSKDLHCQINHKDNIAGINAENAAN